MSKQTMYQTFRAGGLSRAGALGLMGNIGAESNFQANIVESRCPMGSFDYTHNVNIMAISREQFATDSYGYGLCQWTLPYRKRKLWEFAYMENESVGDEAMQVRFILHELQTEGEYQNLYRFLCSTDDMYEATSRICKEYERPAVNNIDVRYAIACQCANEPYDGTPIPGDEDTPPADEPIESCDITVRVLKRGYKGKDVWIMQTILKKMGFDLGSYGVDSDFGPSTEKAVRKFQEFCNLEPTGIFGQDEWQIVYQ